jgi:alpha(1,3/1,4) fucosyltransferase
VLDSDYYDSNLRHKRFPLWARFDLRSLVIPKDLEIFKAKKKFCCMLVSNPNATERIEFFHKLSEYKKVDSAGRYLNNIGHSVENKRDFIKDYKFVLSFENSCYPGYTTEKLVEPMLVNSIPIYWGDPEVGRDFNTESFVNINDFKSYDEAIKYIIELDNDEEKYLAKASKPWFNNNELSDEYTEKSLLNFFDFIIKDSKKKKPVAKSWDKQVWNLKISLKKKIDSIFTKLPS